MTGSLKNSTARCPICSATDTEIFLRRSNTPVHQNMIFRSQDAAIHAARGVLEMTVCRRCGFVFNSSFDVARLRYATAYDNNQAHSSSFQSYLEELTHHLIHEQGVQGQSIVDVGCGNGEFLRTLVRDPDLANTGHGFDPAYRGPDCDCDGRARFIRTNFGPDCATVRADVVVCRHVIEHVPDPVQLLSSVREALEGSKHARVYFETPDVTWILRNHVIWDFFYEHCSLFSPDSLCTAFEHAGFQVTDVRRVFQGQYLWIEANVGETLSLNRWDAGDIPILAEAYAAREADLRVEWDDKLADQARLGKVALWGAGAKGVTFANLIDPHRDRIDCIVDLNPNKQGGFLPGTGHPIVDFRELRERGVRTAILMNPNYLPENQRLLAESQLEVELIG